MKATSAVYSKERNTMADCHLPTQATSSQPLPNVNGTTALCYSLQMF